jgi:hypothetical protein
MSVGYFNYDKTPPCSSGQSYKLNRNRGRKKRYWQSETTTVLLSGQDTASARQHF